MEYSPAIVDEKSILPHAVAINQSMRDLFNGGVLTDCENTHSLLILGEKGTGKELLAKTIHSTFSPHLPFYSINCVNLPVKHFEEKIDECLEVFSDRCEQFLKFSHSVSKQPTLFLRDIGKLDKTIQKELLLLLKQRFFDQNKSSAKKEKKNLRLIFSSTKNSSAPQNSCVTGDVFRGFKPFLLSIKPLRNRKKDIKPLALYFMHMFCREYEKDIGGIHSEALKLLYDYSWPGNVGDLKGVIENAVLLCQGLLITADDIRFNTSKKSVALESFLNQEDFFNLDDLEKIYINTVLRRVKNNKSKASRILGISRNTLQRKLDSFSLNLTQKKPRKKKNSQPTLF